MSGNQIFIKRRQDLRIHTTSLSKIKKSKKMKASAKGNAHGPEKNVKAKAGLSYLYSEEIVVFDFDRLEIKRKTNE